MEKGTFSTTELGLIQIVCPGCRAEEEPGREGVGPERAGTGPRRRVPRGRQAGPATRHTGTNN